MAKALYLTPLDTLLFRDARPFGEASRAQSVLPRPSTCAGAIRTWLMTAMGCDFDRLSGDISKGASLAEALGNQADRHPALPSVSEISLQGPWFHHPDHALLFPVPASLRRHKTSDTIFRLDPTNDPKRIPGWACAGQTPCPLWHTNGPSGAIVPGFLTTAGMETFLRRNLPDSDAVVPATDVYDFDNRVGVGIDADTLASVDSLLYSVSMLALKDGVTIYLEIDAPDDTLAFLPQDASSTLALGGEGRAAAMHVGPPIALPSAPDPTAAGKLWVLTAPAPFDTGWRAPWMAPVAAAVPGYHTISGWDLARNGPKPTRFAADAGSVYFMNQDTSRSETSLCEPDDALLGWGTYLEGSWNYV